MSAPGSRRSLRNRLALTLVGLACLAVASLGGVYLATEHVIEDAALRGEMVDDLDAFMARAREGRQLPLLSTKLHVLGPAGLPEPLRGLAPGTFRRMRLDGKPVQVLVAADDAGSYVLIHDLTLSVQRERSLLWSLAAGTCVTAIAAWWASGRLARRILSPLSGLVEQIRKIDPLRPAERPVERTGDADLDAIPDAVNGLVRELDHVLRRERAFADAASHELRTPLAVVRGAIDVLRARGEAPSNVTDRMDRAVRRAQEDLDALLALSPAREPAPAVAVDLKELLPSAAEPYLREAAGTRVVWTWPGRTEACVAPAALAIVFTNLLRNALRATPRGEVRIEADAAALRIIDDGEGLPAGWPAAQEPRGRGLGLSIARALAERHGWQLAVEPGQAGGTRATLTLDATAPGPPGT